MYTWRVCVDGGACVWEGACLCPCVSMCACISVCSGPELHLTPFSASDAGCEWITTLSGASLDLCRSLSW